MSKNNKERVTQEIISFYTVFQEEILDVFADETREISPLLFKALCEIYFIKNITSSLLAKRLSITLPNTSRTLKKLSDLGYIIRIKDEHDKRITHLKLTKEGFELVENSLRFTNDLILRKLSVLEMDELLKLSEAFCTITNLFIKIGELNS